MRHPDSSGVIAGCAGTVSLPSQRYAIPLSTSGATISEKNAMSLYSLTLDDLQNAFIDKKLQFQYRSYLGNCYRLYVKKEL